MKIQINNLQFARCFLLDEIGLDDHLTQEILSKTIDVSFSGEPNTLIPRGDKEIIYQQPSSITHFLFYTLYHAISPYVVSYTQKDKLSLGLLQMCNNYVHHDFEPYKSDGPPVLLDFDKLAIPSFVIHEILEPLVGRIQTRRVMFSNCKFTDAARIIESDRDLPPKYVASKVISHRDYPFIYANTNIYNDASKLSDIIVKTLEVSLGVDKAKNILRNLLLDPNSGLMGNMILVLKVLNGTPDFILDFLKYLESNLGFTEEECGHATDIQFAFVRSDKYLNNQIKMAYANPNPQIMKQWSQWSMLMGLIEKQLEPMRGSMWPATENLKPEEDKRRKMMSDKREEKNKNQLNFEEMLEVARDVYNHNAVEPGMLYEVMLKDQRVWKT